MIAVRMTVSIDADSALQGVAQRLLSRRRTLLRRVGVAIKRLVVQRSPSRRQPERRPRWVKLRRSWRVRTTDDEVTVRTRNPKAHWYEGGTAPHALAPVRAKALRIGRRFAARAQHPGQPPRPFLPSAAEVEAVATPVLEAQVRRLLEEG